MYDVKCRYCLKEQDDVWVNYDDKGKLEPQFTSLNCNHCGRKGGCQRNWKSVASVDPESFEVAGEIRMAELSYRDPDGKKHFRKFSDSEKAEMQRNPKKKI